MDLCLVFKPDVHWPKLAHAWFLKIAFVYEVSMCVCMCGVCVCVQVCVSL